MALEYSELWFLLGRSTFRSGSVPPPLFSFTHFFHSLSYGDYEIQADYKIEWFWMVFFFLFWDSDDSRPQTDPWFELQDENLSRLFSFLAMMNPLELQLVVHSWHTSESCFSPFFLLSRTSSRSSITTACLSSFKCRTFKTRFII